MNPVIRSRSLPLPAPYRPARGAAAPTAGICELICAEHARILRLFGALSDLSRREAGGAARSPAGQLWARLAVLLDVHTTAEEEICYPVLFGHGRRATAALEAAAADHADIREAVAESRLLAAGSAQWWRAVTAAQRFSTDHFAAEERQLLAAVNHCLPAGESRLLARRWEAFTAAELAGTPGHGGRRATVAP
jgi:hypothetical protein